MHCKYKFELREEHSMKIALGADHGGYALKEEIKKMLERLGHS